MEAYDMLAKLEDIRVAIDLEIAYLEPGESQPH